VLIFLYSDLLIIKRIAYTKDSSSKNNMSQNINIYTGPPLGEVVDKIIAIHTNRINKNKNGLNDSLVFLFPSTSI